jgi:hypothetical protein
MFNLLATAAAFFIVACAVVLGSLVIGALLVGFGASLFGATRVRAEARRPGLPAAPAARALRSAGFRLVPVPVLTLAHTRSPIGRGRSAP